MTTRRKAFEDTGKWMIFKSPITKKWTVTPPLGVDIEIWEGEFPNFKTARAYFALAYSNYMDSREDE